MNLELFDDSESLEAMFSAVLFAMIDFIFFILDIVIYEPQESD